MRVVRFRITDASVAEPDIHYGVLVDNTVHCACGCGCCGSFELEDGLEILDSYEPLESEFAEMMGWPYSQDTQMMRWHQNAE